MTTTAHSAPPQTPLVNSSPSTSLGVAMGAAGIAIFALIYYPQPLLPALARDYGAGVATVSLATTTTTAALALSILFLSGLADRFGRPALMRAGLGIGLVASFATIACHQLWQFLALRGVVGIALGAVVATAMAHAGAEAAPSRVGRAMGLYIGGTSAGGAIGRLLPGALVDSLSWRGATVAVTVMCAGAIAVFVATLPPPRASSVAARRARSAAARTGAPVSYLRAHRRSWRLCFLGFTLMGAYVSTFSLLAFRLQQAPFRLPMTVISLLYLLGVAGTISSPLAGRLADRRGRPRVLLASMSIAGLGLALTTSHEVTVVIAGLALFAAAFFAAHGVATGWVSATAGDASGRASASYLTAYYSGSAILAPTTALVFQHAGWTVAVVTLIALLVAAQLAMLGAEREGAKRSGPVRRIALALGR